MSKIYQATTLIVLIMLVASCAAPTVVPTVSSTPSPTLEPLPTFSIARRPQPAIYSQLHVYTQPPVYDPTESWPVDLRSSDLTKLDLSKSTDDLLFADFDSKTQWPPRDRMPADFNWQRIMEIGKDPGLGMRSLHEQDITGKGVGIAIIDTTLLVDHIEYIDNLRLYEEQERRDRGMVARPGGTAVASIAVGKTVGVAPNADLYYIAAPLCFENTDFSCLARSVRRVIDLNETLPLKRKIRVLAITLGWGPNDLGYNDIMTAVKDATAAGIFVISPSLPHTHGLHFHGLGRNPLSDPNDFGSYQPGLWWQDNFYAEGFYYSPLLLVPMDSRTTASPTGILDYVFFRRGGWNWSISYLAGMYALAAQVKPEITPEGFWQIALETGKTIQIGHNGKDYEFGVILDPQELIEAIKSK